MATRSSSPVSREPPAPFARVADDVAVAALLQEVKAAPRLWLKDTSRQRKVRCQRHTLNIFLRVATKPLPAGARNANDVHESRLASTAASFPRTLAFLEETARREGGVLGRATLVSLLPGKRVYPHTDAGAYYRIRDRYHLVLHSPAGSPLTVGGQSAVMREGELWVFDNKIRHSAENRSDTPRIHLIFDLLPVTGPGRYVRSLDAA